MKVKICGITNLGDALGASEAGADFLGFILFPPSKRAITAHAAKEIVSKLRQLPNCPILVGVFVNESGERMADLLDEIELDLAQLSGEEVPSLIGGEHSPILGRSYKALRPATLAEAEADAEWFIPDEAARSPAFPSLLIDTYHPTLRGGTGETGDWALSASLAEDIPGLMLAGGLTAENVATAVRQVRPFAVDVASGVESSPGRKDLNLVRSFINNAKSAV